jgi:hypothetical protein
MSLWYRILFSDKAYEKNLQVKTYILRSDQVAYLLNNPNEEPEQLIGSEIATATNYLVVRVKNMGEKHAWGTLACTVPAVWDPINVPIVSIGDEFCNYIISLDKIAVLFSHDTFAPKVTFKWYQLYTK